MLRRRSRLQAMALACIAVLPFTAAQAAERRPVAAITIYPGDVIRDDMLKEMDVPDAIANSAFVPNKADLIGKVARHTLLPGQPIATNAVSLPRLVSVGAMVRLVYAEGGLSISTYAAALQTGSAGDVISVRNPESGVIISGVVQTDGSILIGNS